VTEGKPSHMLVQYLVGLCCLRTDPEAVRVELGDFVFDDASGTTRDVDVTVTVADPSGDNWAFKAFEVKDEKPSLDVSAVEQLCIKLNDMSSVTHRAVVSSSGFSHAAKAKAEHHGVDLYTLEKWTTPIDVDFPKFGLKGLPEEAIPFSQQLLVWIGADVFLVAPSAKGNFNVENGDALFDTTGAVHTRYATFEQFKKEILLRSTEALYLLNPAKTMRTTLPEFYAPGMAATREWPHSHTLDVSADDVYIRADDLVKLERITITGSMRWEREIEQPDFRVMRRVGDGKPFAGALIALGQREGQMLALVMSDSPVMGIHFVKLEEQQLNMIRQLRLKGSPEDEASKP
jgi:hypothetical protein